MDAERERDQWTDEDERHPEGAEEPIPVQEEGLAVGLEGQDGYDADRDPEIAQEVELQEETREAEGEAGDEEVETVLNFREDEADAGG
jgi:hypothetical protein